MAETVRQKTFAKNLVAAATDQLFERRKDGGVKPRRRFVAFVLLCLFLHASIFAILMWQDHRAAMLAPPPLEEVPVEVITEPPPQEPPKPPEPQPEPKQEQQKPPPPPPVVEEPAFDAPKMESKTKSERDAPEDQEQKAPRKAEPTDKVTQKDEKPQGLKDATDTDGAAKAPEAAPQKQIEDKPDAEIIEQAQQTPKTIDKTQAQETKTAKKGDAPSIADQIAGLAPIPDYKIGAPPKFSPVGGGQAKTTYLTILYGLIMPHMRIPSSAKANPTITKGVVSFYIDEAGNLTHQAIYKSSGSAELDAAAISAVRQAAPFPPPPRGLPHAMLFSYATK